MNACIINYDHKRCVCAVIKINKKYDYSIARANKTMNLSTSVENEGQ